MSFESKDSLAQVPGGDFSPLGHVLRVPKELLGLQKEVATAAARKSMICRLAQGMAEVA